MADNSTVVVTTSWNQDNGCFALGTNHGFLIYNSQPLKQLAKRDVGGVQCIALLNRSNLLALVGGGGRNPLDSNNKVLIWDDRKRKVVATIEFKLKVLGLRFRKDRLVVVLQDMVCVYDFPGTADRPLAHLHTFETYDNPLGLIAVCPAVGCSSVAMLGRQMGHVHVVDIKDLSVATPIMLKAHQHEIAQMTISVSGQWLATASTNGTLVRVFSLHDRQLAHEFRRGYAPTKIFSLQFNLDCSLLAASSDRTVHVFSLKQPEKNVTSGFAAVGDYLPLLKRKAGRSFVSFSTPCPATCAFGSDRRSVLAVCQNQTFYQFAFNELGACPDQHRFWRLLKPDLTEVFRVEDPHQRSQTPTREAEKEGGTPHSPDVQPHSPELQYALEQDDWDAVLGD